MKRAKPFTLPRPAQTGLLPFGLITAFALSTGCVPKARYEEARLNVRAANEEIALLANRLEESEKNRAAEREICDALNERLQKGEAERLRLRETNAELSVALQEARDDLRRFRDKHPGVEAERAIYFRLTDALKTLVMTGIIEIRIENRHVLLRLRADSTFDGQGLALVPESARILETIGAELTALEGRRFRVEVAVDDPQVPPDAASLASSGLDLSARRAAVIAEALMKGGLDPKRIAATGLGAARPLVMDTSPEGRARNRRIDIVIEHRLEDLPPLQDGFPDIPLPDDETKEE